MSSVRRGLKRNHLNLPCDEMPDVEANLRARKDCIDGILDLTTVVGNHHLGWWETECFVPVFETVQELSDLSICTCLTKPLLTT